MKTTQNNILEVGTYNAKVIGFGTRQPKDVSKSPYIHISFITEDGHEVSFNGSLKKNPELERDAYTITFEALRRLGFKPENKSTFEKDVIGKETEIAVEHKPNEKGELYAYVKFINGKKTYTKVSLADVLGDDDEAPAPKAARGTTVKFS